LEDDTGISISSKQLCQYLAVAERGGRQEHSLIKHSLPIQVKKRKRSETPPEEITSSDVAGYVDNEQRAAKHAADHDDDYIDTSTESLTE
jgi:hypothetical protein